MRRLYSHYTFIYPNVYLKNHIVELDKLNRIVRVFPYAKEIEKTEFYSGLLKFIPEGTNEANIIFNFNENEFGRYLSHSILWKNSIFDIIYNDNYV